MTFFPIETKRLILRKFTPADAEATAAYQGLPEVARYCMWEPRSLERVRELIPRWIAMDGTGENSEGIQYAVVLRTSGALIGDVVLMFEDLAARQGQIGYVMSPAFQGQGYATEAMEAVLAVGFGQVGLHRISARCDARNTGSWRVMEKLGMRREAHFREHAIFKGEWDQELVYAILEDEWRAAQGAN
ncbi:GNAT family N-acetyltransferase [Pelagibacterium halotolerans]|uniref:Putative acetyltransferase n=1 Tax=Pelagibacterium halotolerans (strain DSM 22347 / JCM 15775 / CGMCC 1.7692 / B2) TaxID=1082931 RepID=G4RE82_PELHB|nr:GNAT family protein [Pelagibacterium halotolerans]AEQ51846.1 putative acetyltransferase [Pelagibacterium halotolerans B2]QJR18347.1 GNAT family N-acetyltransferase [Pelagibacterium halotolerans]SEA24990.1 Protein N-acetyltransferase, RimJ/RimL family [Pelagibacterium halotolerans]